jgi:hypothetical protein
VSDNGGYVRLIMREKLKAISGVRARFRGRFERTGERTSAGYVKPMALLRDVCDLKGNEMCDHVWLNMCKAVEGLELKSGDWVEFDARVRPYWKGYHDNRQMDYRLSHPTRMVKLDLLAKPISSLLLSENFEEPNGTRQQS